MTKGFPQNIPQIEPSLGEEERIAVDEYLRSGGWLTEYKRTREFENMIKNFLGIKHATVMVNGTLSLTAAMMALDIGPGDEVLVPDFTMIASANSIILTGAKPVLVDVSQADLCIDLQDIKKKISNRTKAIIAVSLNGRCPRIQEIREFAESHGLWLIEDAAQSLGSQVRGTFLGTVGDVGSFSFSMPKIITTGQGGAVVTNDDEINEKLRLIKDFGRPTPGEDNHVTSGFNFKFTDLQAVIGIEQMKKLPARMAIKKSIYGSYLTGLVDCNWIRFIDTDLKGTVPWFMDILAPTYRDPLFTHLRNAGIGTRPFYPAIHTQSPYSQLDACFPNATAVSESGLWLPSSISLSESDIDRICEIVKQYAQ